MKSLRPGRTVSTQRWFGVLSAAMLLSASLVILSAKFAYATTYCNSPPNHCYAIALNTTAVETSGMWASWKSATINPGNYVHVNQSMWLTLDDTSGTTLEMGVGASPGYYFQFIAESNGSPVWSHIIPADGTSHTYDIGNVGGGYWSYYIDGYAVTFNGSTRHLYGSNTSMSNTEHIGGETQVVSGGLDGSGTTALFTDYVQYQPVGKPGVPWTSWNMFIDYPCDGPPWHACYRAYNDGGSSLRWNWQLY
jgi:hypothetical protein